MRFLLSVIAFCLVMITAKLYIPVAQAQECGTFDEKTLMYIVCDDEDKPKELKVSPTGLTAKKIYELDYSSSLRVNCVSGYVFVQNREGGVTQYMYWSEEHNTIKPVQCVQYRR